MKAKSQRNKTSCPACPFTPDLKISSAVCMSSEQQPAIICAEMEVKLGFSNQVNYKPLTYKCLESKSSHKPI